MKNFTFAITVLLLLTACEFRGLQKRGAPSSDLGGTLPPEGRASPPPVPNTPSNSPQNPGSTGSSGGKGSLGIAAGKSAEKSLTSDRASRFYVHVPQNYREDTPVGLVFLFHGVEGSDDPVGFFINVRNFVNDERFLLVAPAGDVEDGGSGAWCQPFAGQVFEAVQRAFNIDFSRQYLLAVSGGVYPALPFALSHPIHDYENPCGQIMKAGFQANFAAVAFTAPATSPQDSMLGDARLTSAKLIGFAPSLWADYGEQSRDGANATSLVNWAKSNGYGSTHLVTRTGEGHAPEPPYTYLQTVFEMFEKTRKP